MRHIIWDWNGTLFDDLHIVVESVNASLAELGAPPIDADGYRDHYTRPVHLFYERLLGRGLDDAEWKQIDLTFHDTYRLALPRADLALDAIDALETVAVRGWTQSILSMWWHSELVPFVEERRLDRFMQRVDGNRNDAGETKQTHLERHLDALGISDLGAAAFLVVGDALDDARAAIAAGVPCALYDSGSHHRAEFETAGVPVVQSLREALDA
ncbi:MAG: HAD hydrolase-like protein [Acidimicrobiia bacterium]|nr:HAD hydrolase-like protein [Acidimicrobiia bacterium]